MEDFDRQASPSLQQADLLIVGASEMLTCRAPGNVAVGSDLAHVETIRDGAIAIRDGRIMCVGTTAEVRAAWSGAQILDARGSLVTPGLVDCHTHLIHGGTRHDEWEYIARRESVPLADGIRSTLEMTASTSASELRRRALSDLDVALAHGTTTMEAKSGYGRNMEEELRLLRIAQTLSSHPVDVIPTFLGAHVIPSEYRDRRDYFLDTVVDTVPEVADLAEYVDVCVDPVAFSREECERIALAALDHGLGVRVHADQTGLAGGARFAADIGAAAADHLDYSSDADLEALARAGCVGVLVPGVAHHLIEVVPSLDSEATVDKAFLPGLARRMISRNVHVAVATDYNPGTSPTLSMQTAMQLAARTFALSYAEVWYMATLNAAKSMNRSNEIGSLEEGKAADVVIWSVPEHGLVINRFGTNLARMVVKRGRLVYDARRTGLLAAERAQAPDVVAW